MRKETFGCFVTAKSTVPCPDFQKFPGLKQRHRCREQMYGHQGGKVAGGGGMNWEIGIDIYTLICIKQITNKNLLYKNK